MSRAPRPWARNVHAQRTSTTIQFENPLTHEVRLAIPQGVVVVERMMVSPPGRERPRMYFVGMAGRIDPDGEEVKRLFDSFKVND